MSELVITVNGDTQVVPHPSTLEDLLGQLDLDPRAVVVELNREIIRRARLGETWLANGDTVEIVHFVGGG